MDAAAEAQGALNTLVDIQSEYEDWHGNLPENLIQSALGEKLEAVVSMELQCALDTVDEATDADLPRGFGND